ncbi:MAG: hypothetical protein IPH48_16520 [bacterium]|nr:hypothetical protein [bacterium]
MTTTMGSVCHCVAISIKSNAQFKSSAAPSDFVSCCWEQWLHIGTSVFDHALDYMALVTAPLPRTAVAAVSELSEKARVADPTLFPVRLAQPDWANEKERRLFTSFACPAALNKTGLSEVDTARLLQRLRFVQRDFGVAGSKSLKDAIDLCRRCVRSHSTQAAEDLWNLLRGIAAEYRPRAGSITLHGLVDRLRGRVLLAEYPDYVADWVVLDARSKREVILVSDSIAGRIRISRDGNVDALSETVAASNLVALLGASGAGKSALARAFFERRRVCNERTLWLDARSLDCADFGLFESALQIKASLTDLLGTATDQNPLLILDGLDRLYSEQAFRNVAILLSLVRQKAPATSWRIVAPCQSQEWPRVLEGLHRAGAERGAWTSWQLEALAVAELKPVRDAVPAIGRLLLQPRVSSLLTNLKMLDLVVRRVDEGGTIDSTGWVGESSVAEWFWTAEIDCGPERLARGRLVRSLAELQADQLVAFAPVESFGGSELGLMQSLIAGRLCVEIPGNRIAFAHDLYGDWVRLHILLDHSEDLPEFFRERGQSPLWQRTPTIGDLPPRAS